MKAKIRHVYFHSEDLDGWLAFPNEPLLPVCGGCLADLQGLTIETAGEIHQVQIVLNSGKSPAYLEQQARLFGGQYVIACNGAAWRECSSGTHRWVSGTRDFAVLRRLLAIPSTAVGVVSITIGRLAAEVAVEEGKVDEEGDIVLTLFPEAALVARRWQFRQGIDRYTLRKRVCDLIREHGLALHVLEPHRDGALDIVPLADGRPLAKWTLPSVAAQMFPSAVLHLTHGGDSSSDLPGMEAEGVVPLSAANCPDTLLTASRKGGVVASRPAPDGGAAIECYQELARRGFYGPLSERVAAVCRKHLARTKVA
jgi:hypothetical protein